MEKTKITFECVKGKGVIDDKKLYLVYERQEDRKFAPQFRLNLDELNDKINLYDPIEFDIIVKHCDSRG